jgi:hypothetical protein
MVAPSANRDLVRGVRIVKGDVGVNPNLLFRSASPVSARRGEEGEWERTEMLCFLLNWMEMR